MISRLLIFLIGVYRAVISPLQYLFDSRGFCRFSPGCASYAQDAIRLHGAVRGTQLAVKRIGRCHPWHPGGYDPVPPVCERVK
jgi:putative membrane protein insertion efficiency factor